MENLNTQDQLNACQESLSTLQSKYVYLNAELENYKRRVEKERASWITGCQAAVFADFLEIVDDFQRALDECKAKQESADFALYLAGFELTFKSLQKLLKKYDVTEITENNSFNTDNHEAIMQIKSESHSSGQIVQVLQKGYKIKNQVLRPSKVSIAE